MQIKTYYIKEYSARNLFKQKYLTSLLLLYEKFTMINQFDF